MAARPAARAAPPGARRSGALGTASPRPRRLDPSIRLRSYTPGVATVAELAEDRIIEGIYAVARKEKLRTRGGAPYLALELIDASGRIEARVWNDVELLDGRFREGDTVRVLGRVERF